MIVYGLTEVFKYDQIHNAKVHNKINQGPLKGSSLKQKDMNLIKTLTFSQVKARITLTQHLRFALVSEVQRNTPTSHQPETAGKTDGGAGGSIWVHPLILYLLFLMWTVSRYFGFSVSGRGSGVFSWFNQSRGWRQRNQHSSGLQHPVRSAELHYQCGDGSVYIHMCHTHVYCLFMFL